MSHENFFFFFSFLLFFFFFVYFFIFSYFEKKNLHPGHQKNKTAVVPPRHVILSRKGVYKFWFSFHYSLLSILWDRKTFQRTLIGRGREEPDNETEEERRDHPKRWPKDSHSHDWCIHCFGTLFPLETLIIWMKEKIPCYGEFTQRSDPWAGLIASCGSFYPMVLHHLETRDTFGRYIGFR